MDSQNVAQSWHTVVTRARSCVSILILSNAIHTLRVDAGQKPNNGACDGVGHSCHVVAMMMMMMMMKGVRWVSNPAGKPVQ
jgi:hypothetical protein